MAAKTEEASMTESESVEERAILVAPSRVAVELSCPTCGAIYTIPASLGARVVQNDAGEGTIGIRLRADKVAHLCRQLRLELVDDDAPVEPGGPNDGGKPH